MAFRTGESAFWVLIFGKKEWDTERCCGSVSHVRCESQAFVARRIMIPEAALLSC